MKQSLVKRIAIDIAGFSLLIGAVLFGWLPGPGGIPLAIAGLALLSKNHKWAKNIMDYLIKNGSDVKNKIFNDHPILVITYDILAATLVIGGTYLIITMESNLLRTMMIAVIILGLTLFLFNKKRLEKFTNNIKKSKQ